MNIFEKRRAVLEGIVFHIQYSSSIVHQNFVKSYVIVMQETANGQTNIENSQKFPILLFSFRLH